MMRHQVKRGIGTTYRKDRVSTKSLAVDDVLVVGDTIGPRNYDVEVTASQSCTVNSQEQQEENASFPQRWLGMIVI